MFPLDHPVRSTLDHEILFGVVLELFYQIKVNNGMKYGTILILAPDSPVLQSSCTSVPVS